MTSHYPHQGLANQRQEHDTQRQNDTNTRTRIETETCTTRHTGDRWRKLMRRGDIQLLGGEWMDGRKTRWSVSWQQHQHQKQFATNAATRRTRRDARIRDVSRELRPHIRRFIQPARLASKTFHKFLIMKNVKLFLTYKIILILWKHCRFANSLRKKSYSTVSVCAVRLFT